MAIRLRRIEGMWTALCAAESEPQSGDLYIDDGQHGALTKKFEEDFKAMGFWKDPQLPSEGEEDTGENWKPRVAVELVEETKEPCPDCGGKGWIPGEQFGTHQHVEPCPKCKPKTEGGK